MREGSFCIGDYKGGSFPCWSSGAGPCRGWNINQKSPERSSFPAELMSQQGITSMPWPWGSWDRSCGTALGLLPHPELPPTQTLPWFHNDLLWCSSSSHSPGSAWNGRQWRQEALAAFQGLFVAWGRPFLLVVLCSSKTASGLRLFGLHRQRWHVSEGWGAARSCCQHSWMSLVWIWCLSRSAATLQSLLEATSVGAQLCHAPTLHTVRGWVMFEQEPCPYL